MADSIPITDAQFNDWMLNFASVASDNSAALHLTAAQLLALNTAAGEFSDSYTASEAAKLAAKAAVTTKNESREIAEQLAREYIPFFASNPLVSNALLGQLGINTTPGSLGPVVVPTNMSATGFSNGDNKLKWNRSTNAQGTVFVIEAKYGLSTTWSQIGTTTKTKWTHEAQTPGDMVTYRVYATRADDSSGYSNEAVVYSNGEASFLSIAA